MNRDPDLFGILVPGGERTEGYFFSSKAFVSRNLREVFFFFIDFLHLDSVSLKSADGGRAVRAICQRHWAWIPRAEGAGRHVAKPRRDFVVGMKETAIKNRDESSCIECRTNGSMITLFAGWNLVPLKCGAESAVRVDSCLAESSATNDDRTPLKFKRKRNRKYSAVEIALFRKENKAAAE